MIQQMVDSKTTAGLVGTSIGLATVLDYFPKVAGGLLSVAGIIWIGIQAYYLIKSKRK